MQVKVSKQAQGEIRESALACLPELTPIKADKGIFGVSLAVFMYTFVQPYAYATVDDAFAPEALAAMMNTALAAVGFQESTLQEYMRLLFQVQAASKLRLLKTKRKRATPAAKGEEAKSSKSSKKKRKQEPKASKPAKTKAASSSEDDEEEKEASEEKPTKSSKKRTKETDKARSTKKKRIADDDEEAEEAEDEGDEAAEEEETLEDDENAEEQSDDYDLRGECQ